MRMPDPSNPAVAEELAKEFEPSGQTIRNWVAQADRDAGRREDGLTTAERDELSRLRRENRQLKLECGSRSSGASRSRAMLRCAVRRTSVALTAGQSSWRKVGP
jgi:transposase-like protein